MPIAIVRNLSDELEVLHTSASVCVHNVEAEIWTKVHALSEGHLWDLLRKDPGHGQCM